MFEIYYSNGEGRDEEPCFICNTAEEAEAWVADATDEWMYEEYYIIHDVAADRWW